MGDLGVQPVEDGLAKAGRHTGRHHRHLGAHGVALLAQGVHVGFELRHPVRVGTEEGVALHLLPIQPLRPDRTQLGEIAANPNAQSPGQVFLGDAPRRHPHGGLPGGGAAAAPMVGMPVLTHPHVVGMSLPRLGLDLLVVG